MKHLHGHRFCTTSVLMLVAWPSHESSILGAFNIRACNYGVLRHFNRRPSPSVPGNPTSEKVPSSHEPLNGPRHGHRIGHVLHGTVVRIPPVPSDRPHALPDVRSYPVLHHTVNMVTTPLLTVSLIILILRNHIQSVTFRKAASGFLSMVSSLLPSLQPGGTFPAWVVSGTRHQTARGSGHCPIVHATVGRPSV